MVRNVEKGDDIKKTAKRLCENRSHYNSNDYVEREIIDDVKQKDYLKELVSEVISSLHGNDGNIRLGAAEILGVITPLSMVNVVLEELKKHLNDNFIRDYAYGGFQGDEYDMRTVAECCRASIKKLNKLVVEN